MPAKETELFIALVAALGTDVGMVGNELETQLSSYGYTTYLLRLSGYLAELRGKKLDDLPHDMLLYEAMSAGDALRRDWQRGDALALAAVSDIVATRREQAAVIANAPEDTPANLDRAAFIIRSLKTPDELRTLRAVYGPRLLVIAAYSPEPKRKEQLAEEIRASRKNGDVASWSYTPDELIARDMDEELVGGQDVSDTFHRADFFIRGWDKDVARPDIERALEIIFGHPYRTPTRDEHAQFLAAGEARRSSEPGRQVGAAIARADGAVVALGTNEVPIAGGGSFREGDLGPDNREFAVNDIETNRLYQTELATKMGNAVAGTLADRLEQYGVDDGIRASIEADLADQLPEKLLGSGLKEITEFGRAVHAEMDALLDAARRGIPVEGCTAHTSTFPCHNCARHLVAAGIRRIVFVEPYPKSRARDLHDDSIGFPAEESADKITFEPFVGLAPRRYLDYFDATAREELAGQARKTIEGAICDFDKLNAVPLFTDLVVPDDLRPLLPPYRQRELIALNRFDDLRARGVVADDRSTEYNNNDDTGKG